MDDMSLSYLSGYYKLSDDQAVGLEFRYFDMGDINLFLDNGSPNGSVRPREWAVGGTYSRKLSEKLGVGLCKNCDTSELPKENVFEVIGYVNTIESHLEGQNIPDDFILSSTFIIVSIFLVCYTCGNLIKLNQKG